MRNVAARWCRAKVFCVFNNIMQLRAVLLNNYRRSCAGVKRHSDPALGENFRWYLVIIPTGKEYDLRAMAGSVKGFDKRGKWFGK